MAGPRGGGGGGVGGGGGASISTTLLGRTLNNCDIWTLCVLPAWTHQTQPLLYLVLGDLYIQTVSGVSVFMFTKVEISWME